MRRPRLLPLSLICFLITLISVLLLAQSNSLVRGHVVARIDPANATLDFQTLPMQVALQPLPESQRPVKFRKPVVYGPGGYSPTSVAIADVNGDGYPDLVVANYCQTLNPQGTCNGQPGGVGILLGNGDGTFRAAASYNSGGIIGLAVAVADVNGDGNLDVIVANGCENSSDCNYQGDTGIGGVSVLLGNGDGTFQPAVSYSSGGGYADAIAVADLNGDGNLDLIVANWCQSTTFCSLGTNGLPGSFSVLLGNGDGTFEAPVTYSAGGSDSAAIAVADLNGDGYLDLVIGNEGSPGSLMSVLLGNGDGTFEAPVVYSSGGAIPGSIVIRDVNGDGKLDLVVGGGGAVSVLFGNGDGTFQPPVSYGLGDYIYAIAVGDVNGDGNPDVVAVGRELSVLVGEGEGTFRSYVLRKSGGDAIAIGDVNRDGRPDLVIAGGGGVEALLNSFVAATTMSVTSSLNPSQAGQPVTFTATVTASSGVPNGSVITFYNGAAQIGTDTTTNGIASLTTSFSTAGKYTIKAKYPGDAFHKASSGTVKQVVNP